MSGETVRHPLPDLLDDPAEGGSLEGGGEPRKSLVSAVLHIPASMVILLVRIYQMTLSRMWGPVCRFHPSCSHYFVGAVQKYGLVRGGWRGIKRILRCHPYHPGGYDPP